MRYIIPVLLLLITASSFSCSNDDSLLNFVEITEDFSHIVDPHERWKAYDLEDYSIIQSRSCECEPIGEARILVVKDKISKVEICFDAKKRAKGDIDIQPYCDAKSLEIAKDFVLKVEEAFALIEHYKETAHSVRVEYHPKYGFPTDLNIDIHARIADEEIKYKFRDLKKIDM